MTPEVWKQILELMLQNLSASEIQQALAKGNVNIKLEDIEIMIAMFNKYK